MKQLIKDYIASLSRTAGLLRRENGRFLLAQERRIQKAAAKVLRRQAQWVANEVRKHPKFNAVGVSTNSIESDVEEMLKGMPGKEDITDTIVFYGGLSMEKGGKSNIKKLGLKKFGINFNLKNPAAVKYFTAKRALELSNYRGNINRTTIDKVKALITDKIVEGKSYDEVAQSIMDQANAGVFSRARAEMIAVRESGNSYEQGRKFVVDDFLGKNPSRQVEKKWSTVNDDRVTEECMANQDQDWLNYSQAFKSGDDTAPRDGNPRCRCTVLQQII